MTSRATRISVREQKLKLSEEIDERINREIRAQREAHHTAFWSIKIKEDVQAARTSLLQMELIYRRESKSGIDQSNRGRGVKEVKDNAWKVGLESDVLESLLQIHD